MAWVAVIMLVIFFIEAPVLFRKKRYRELLVFSLLWVAAAVYASLVALDVPLPTVVEALEGLYNLVNL
ncbi:MAG: hypothetical protein GX334_03555 [Firmicutes bacterium]|mgnify:CR=1 FL=1|nr:hypothetical protein [Bacillota bacterium]